MIRTKPSIIHSFYQKLVLKSVKIKEEIRRPAIILDKDLNKPLTISMNECSLL
jgi:hypothetical protein